VEKIVGRKVLESFVAIAPFLNKLLLQDVFVAVADAEAFLAYEPGETIGGKINIGDKFPEGSSLARAMQTRRIVKISNTKEVYGVPYNAIAIPVFDENDRVIGAITIGTSTEHQENLNEIVEQFNSAFTDVSRSVEEIAIGAESLAQTGVALTGTAIEIKDDVQTTDNIIQIISDIADETKLLGLNAAIEAARAGENGRGFAVVAEEIRKLSAQSNNSAKDVYKILTKIGKSIEMITGNIQDMSAVSQEQSAVTEQIVAAMQQLSGQVKTLREFAKII